MNLQPFNDAIPYRALPAELDTRPAGSMPQTAFALADAQHHTGTTPLNDGRDAASLAPVDLMVSLLNDPAPANSSLRLHIVEQYLPRLAPPDAKKYIFARLTNTGLSTLASLSSPMRRVAVQYAADLLHADIRRREANARNSIYGEKWVASEHQNVEIAQEFLQQTRSVDRVAKDWTTWARTGPNDISSQRQRAGILQELHMARRDGKNNLPFTKFNLGSLPPHIDRLFGLRNLFLGGNRLYDIEEKIFRLPHIEGIYLGDNRLTSLPPSAFTSRSLVFLQASQNGLTQLPTLPVSSVADSTLEFVFLADNQLQTIPDWFGFLPRINGVDLQQNHLCEVGEALKNLIVGHAYRLKFADEEQQARDFYSQFGLDAMEEIDNSDSPEESNLTRFKCSYDRWLYRYLLLDLRQNQLSGPAEQELLRLTEGSRPVDIFVQGNNVLERFSPHVLRQQEEGDDEVSSTSFFEINSCHIVTEGYWVGEYCEVQEERKQRDLALRPSPFAKR